MKRVGFQWVRRGATHSRELAAMRGGSLCRIDFPALVGIIRHPDAGVNLFDTGYDAAFLNATASFPERFYRWATPVTLDPAPDTGQWLARHGVREADVSGVILSHFHGDHVAGLGGFARQRIWCAREGLRDLSAKGRFARVRAGLLAELVPADIDARAHYFEDCAEATLPPDFAPFTHGRDLIGDGSLLAVPLPGHCPGHWGLALRIEDGRHVLLIGDAAYVIASVIEHRSPPALLTGMLGDTARYGETLGALNRLARRNPDLVILPSHCVTAEARFAAAAD